MFQPIIAPRPTNNKSVVPMVASPINIDENGKENMASSNIHPTLHYDYKSKDFVHTISQGIKTNKVSDADLLSISLISSAKKRKIYGNETSSSTTLDASSYSAFSRPSPFDFRKGGSLHNTEEEEIEQNHLIDSIVQKATASMPTSPVVVQNNSQITSNNNNHHHESVEHQDMNVEEPCSSNDYDQQDNGNMDNDNDDDNNDMDEGVESSEDWAKLRVKVGQAVMYQLLHVLNHGSIEEVCRLCILYGVSYV